TNEERRIRRDRGARRAFLVFSKKDSPRRTPRTRRSHQTSQYGRLCRPVRDRVERSHTSASEEVGSLVCDRSARSRRRVAAAATSCLCELSELCDFCVLPSCLS